jgi:transposase
LDLVPGQSGKAYSGWLDERGEAFRGGVEVATLYPFHGFKDAIDDQLEDAVAVLDAFHIVKLGTQALDEVRRRVQQETRGHCGRRNDPLYGIHTILRCGSENLTDRQRARLDRAIAADERHDEVSSPGSVRSNCEPPTRRRTRSRAAGSPSGSLSSCRPAPSRRSSDSAAR